MPDLATVFKAIVFWSFAAAVVIPGVLVVTTRDIVRSCFWLLVSMSGVAGIYLLLGADFVGFTQVLIYVGGIMILLLFGILLTSRDPILLKNVPTVRALGLASLTGIVVFGLLAKVALSAPWKTLAGGPSPARYTAGDIGRALMTRYILPFEIVSVLLLVSLVGAAYLARRRD